MVEAASPSPPKTLGRTTAPKPDEWQRWLEYALTLLTAFYTDQITKSIDDLTQDEKAHVDEINADFTKELSEPLANILARSALSKKYGRQIVDSYDWIAVLVAIWAYNRELGEIRQRRRAALNSKVRQPLHVAANPESQAQAATAAGPLVGIPFGATLD